MPPNQSIRPPATSAAGIWIRAATPTIKPISESGMPARERSTGNDAV